jgi:NADPH:quinone reductase
VKAICVKKPGGVEELQLETYGMPSYGDDDVLIAIKAAGINYIDIYIRTGLYKPPSYPHIPGREGSGVIAAVGKNVKDLKEGDRVAFCLSGSGSYAEFTAVPAQKVVLIPDFISFEIAAAAMLQGLTAYYLSHLTFKLSKDLNVLIHAGAGGVGSLLIQMAKIAGTKVITTVSSDEKAQLARSVGADNVVIYTHESFYQAVMDLTHQAGVNVVYDAVGKTTFEDSLKSLAIRGMLVSYGQASGLIPAFDLSKLAEKSLYITRPNLAHYIDDKLALNDMANALFDLIRTDKLKIIIGQRYSLLEAKKAHLDLESRSTVGKSIFSI